MGQSSPLFGLYTDGLVTCSGVVITSDNQNFIFHMMSVSPGLDRVFKDFEDRVRNTRPPPTNMKGFINVPNIQSDVPGFMDAEMRRSLDEFVQILIEKMTALVGTFPTVVPHNVDLASQKVFPHGILQVRNRLVEANGRTIT